MATKVSITPLEDRVVVKPLEAEMTTASGLVIPDTAKEKPQEGEVLAVGPGRFEDGQRLRWTSLSATSSSTASTAALSQYSGEEFLILSARDLLAKIVK